MANDHFTALGAEYHKETQRLEPKFLFFAAVVLLSHVLKITPSDFDAGGVKLVVDDVSIIHGGISLVYLYYFWSYISSLFQGSALMPLEFNRRVARNLLRVAKKPYRDEKTKKTVFRSPKQAKRHAWWSMFGFQLFFVPFALGCVLTMLAAWLVGLYDVWVFRGYLLDRAITLLE